MHSSPLSIAFFITFTARLMFYQPSDIITEITTPTVRMRLLKNGTIHYTYLPNAVLDLQQAILNHQAYNQIKTGQHGLIIDALEGFITPTKEYSAYIKEKEPTTPLIGRAFVTSSLAHKLLVAFHLRFKDSLYPAKVFTTHHQAQDWLLHLQKQK